MIDTKILITQSIHPDGLELLKKHVTNVIEAPAYDEETLLSLIDDDVTGIIVRHNRLTRKIIEKAKNLKVIARHGIGVELIDVQAATDNNVYVVNTPVAAVTSVAEHTIMMILCLAKKFFYADSEFRAGGYDFKNSYAPDDVEGKVLGLVSLGKIASQVAKRAKAFDMKVIAYDPYVDDSVFEQAGVTRVNSLDEVLKESDFVSLHTPLTDSTRYLINYENLCKMKPTAYLINCARGEVVAEKDLIKALDEKIIAGAGLDVFDPEPPTKDNPLFKMDNVVLTPHSSALTNAGKIRMSVQSVEQLLNVLEGRGPECLVNKELKK